MQKLCLNDSLSASLCIVENERIAMRSGCQIVAPNPSAPSSSMASKLDAGFSRVLQSVCSGCTNNNNKQTISVQEAPHLFARPHQCSREFADREEVRHVSRCNVDHENARCSKDGSTGPHRLDRVDLLVHLIDGEVSLEQIEGIGEIRIARVCGQSQRHKHGQSQNQRSKQNNNCCRTNSSMRSAHLTD